MPLKKKPTDMATAVLGGPLHKFVMKTVTLPDTGDSTKRWPIFSLHFSRTWDVSNANSFVRERTRIQAVTHPYS